MQIYVGKNGQQLGPFTLDEVNRKLADGTFSGSDLAWYEGAAGWAPLSGVPGVNIRPAPVAPIVAPSPAAIPVQPAPAPAPAPIRPNASIVQPPKGGTGILALVSWALLGISLVVSFIPIVGCFGKACAMVMALAGIVMGIVMLTRGRALHGILIILGGILVLAVASLVTALANSSFSDWIHQLAPSPSPSAVPTLSPKPSVTPSVSASPRTSAAPSVTVAPDVTAAPRPSTSPRSSSSPHLLISPRQSVEPRDSPSSRPSPSAKFAPRVNPRQSPGPSEDQTQTDNSGGPKAGRQYPRESSDETPQPSPDDSGDE